MVIQASVTAILRAPDNLTSPLDPGSEMAEFPPPMLFPLVPISCGLFDTHICTGCPRSLEAL